MMRILFFLCLYIITYFNSFQAQLKIIIKLDDLTALNGTDSFKLTVDYLAEKKIKSALGIIGNRVDQDSKKLLLPLIDLRDENSNDVFEFWNHGYDHIIPEFKDHDYLYQQQHFEKANKSIAKMLGIQMNTFGAPGNAVDSTTTKVVKENPNYHVFLCNTYIDPYPNTELINLNKRVDMENGTGNVNYDFFVQNYNYFKQFYKDYMVLQGHPNAWQDEQVQEFKKIVTFLKEQGAEFILPNDYYLNTRTLQAPTITKATQTAEENVVLEWKNNDNINNSYRIERSRDGITWRRVNTQYANAFALNKYADNMAYSLADKFVYYRVRINGNVDNVLYSNVVKIELEQRGPFFKILTNPFQESFDIKYKLNKTGTVSLQIFNLEGKLVQHFTDTYQRKNIIQINKINVQELPVGIYVCTFTVNGEIFAKNRIIKN